MDDQENMKKPSGEETLPDVSRPHTLVLVGSER